jgi:hypothetical protein
MKKFFGAILLACVVVMVALAIPASAHPQTATKADIVAAITKMENDGVKADLAGDTSFYDKMFTADVTLGDSDGSVYSKAQFMKMMADTAHNKFTTETLSGLKVRVYGGAAVATYKDTYDAMINGQHRMRTVVSTDTFAKVGGEWKLVASQSTTAK